MRPIFMVVSIFLVNDVQCASDCYCGFGGACRFHPDTHVVVPTDCDKCEEVSKGLYKNCHELQNHCESGPCTNGGTCFMTYGGFFCRCPPKFYGHMCESRRKKYETFEAVSGPRVWYQVNRIWGGLTKKNQFINLAVESPGDGMVVQVRFDDGRMVTILDTDLRMSNERQKCLEEIKNWPTSTDPNICETLPDAVFFSNSLCRRVDGVLHNKLAKELKENISANLCKVTMAFKNLVPTLVPVFCRAKHNCSKSTFCAVLSSNALEVHGTTIEMSFFDDKFREEIDYIPVTANVHGKNVTEGRLDDIHITILNWKRITYSEYYRIHTVFDIWPKCLYKIDFFGCSVARETPVVHEGENSIFLKSIRIPTNDCSVGRIKKMHWHMTGLVQQPFLSSPDKEEVYLDGSDLTPGEHFIDFLMLVEGRPPYHGHPDLSYNYGRCWIKIVNGEFKVGLEGGNSRAVPCIKPLSFRIFSYNRNYVAKDFASIWRCNYKNWEVCEKQRFLGPKIFFRSLPCETTIVFKAMVIDVPTGSKTFLTATVKTSIHVDSLRCSLLNMQRFLLFLVLILLLSATGDFYLLSCTYNCYPAINPLSTTKMKVEVIRLSTATASFRIKWEATFADEPWGIERFIVPETQETAIEIPPHTFDRLTEQQIAYPYLRITASKNELYCTISADVTVPMKKPMVGWSVAPQYMEEVKDERFRVFILEHPVLYNSLPVSYMISEKIAPNSTDKEIVEFILGDVQQFAFAKLQNPSYITSTNNMGVPSPEVMIPTSGDGLNSRNLGAIKGTIELIRNLASSGNDNLALTEMLYVSRSIAMSDKQKYSDKMRIMEIMNYIANGLDRSASNLVVSAKLNKVLHTMNRLMLVSNLTEHPYNVSIYPWKLPTEVKRKGTVKNYVNMYMMAAETLHSVTEYYYCFVSKRLTVPNDVHVLNLMFESLLRLQLAKGNLNIVMRSFDENPLFRFQNRREAVEMIAFMEKAITLLLKSMDFHIDGHVGQLNMSIGTSTASGSVLPAYSAPEWSKQIFNDYQHIRLSVNVYDPALEESDSLYLGVFVQIPIYTQLTTRVHVLLLTHLTQRNVMGLVDVQLNVSHYRNSDRISMIGIAESSKRRPVTVFKLELDSEPDVIDHQIVRQVFIHFESNVSIRTVLLSRVPEYIDVAHTPSTRNTELVQIINYNDTYLGVLPGIDVRPEVPISFKIDMTQFVCVQKRYDDPTKVDSLNTKSVCKMLPTAHQDSKLVTCSCLGSGMIETYPLGLRVENILTDFENTDRSGLKDLRNRDYNFFLLVYPLLMVFIIILAWWRDKKSWKREFIQQLADTFPGDRFAYVVCVCTGKKIFSGTRAHVGIKLFGSLSASRVHILHSKSYRVLGWGQDDWFVIFTPERLGKLNHMSLWQDYSKPCSGWYCSQVLVYDVESQAWSKFIVQKWLHISADTDKSRITIVRSRKYIPERDLAERFTFTQHYWREIKNTHSLISPFTKQRRFVHSYRMRACLTIVFVLTLVSTVIIMDYYFREIGKGLHYDNIFGIAWASTILASVPYTIATIFFTRSIVKMRKTKTLDLNWVEHMKPHWANAQEQWNGRQNAAYSMHPDFSETDFGSKVIEVQEERKPPKKRERPKKGSQFSNQSYSLSMHKWMPSSIFRPIRVEDYGHKRQGMVPYACGWATVTATVLANMAFLVCWLSQLGWLQGRNGLLIVVVAIALESVRSSLVLLLLSCYTVYSQKRCNFEINCLDLTGLRNDARIVDHVRFLKDTTKPYYHPLEKSAIVALYKKKMKMMTYLKAFAFFCLCIGMILPTIVLVRKRDIPNIYRVQKGTGDLYKEPMLNNYTTKLILLKKVHTPEDIYSYVLSTVMPVGRVYKWYNNKLMRPKNYFNEKTRKFWFADRSTKLHGTSTIRIIQATNESKRYVAKNFRGLDLPIFSVAYGQFYKFATYKTTYNRWHEVIMKTKSTVISDILKYDGVTGVTGMFYPSSIGDEIILQRDMRHKDEGISQAMEQLVTKNTRAIIVEISLIHPLFSQESYNSLFGYTVLQLLFENCATGLYTVSINTYFSYAKSSWNYLRLGLIFGSLMIACIIPLFLNLSYVGFKACFKKLLYWVLFLGSISCFMAAATQLAIHHYVEGQDQDTGEYGIRPIDYHNISWLIALSHASIGCFLLLGTLAWVVWWAGLTGMVKRNVKSNTESLLLTVFLIYIILTVCIGSLSNQGKLSQNLELIFERIDKNTYRYKSPNLFCFTLIIISLTILWPLQIGVVIHVTSSYLNNAHIQGDPTDKMFNAAHYIEHSSKKWSGDTAETNEHDRSQDAILNQSRAEGSSPPHLRYAVPDNTFPSPTERLDSKFSMWK